MGLEQAAIVLAGALAGGVVNGLTGFGTAITALGIWVYGIPPAAAASLAIICAAVSQTQTLHLIWRSIQWPRVLCFVIPGAIGVPIGTLILPHVDPRIFKLGLGLFLVVYPAYVLLRRHHLEHAWGGRTADGVIGFGGGILGGLDRSIGRLPSHLDRCPRLEQRAAPRRRSVFQPGDPVACAGGARPLGNVDAAGRP